MVDTVLDPQKGPLPRLCDLDYMGYREAVKLWPCVEAEERILKDKHWPSLLQVMKALNKKRAAMWGRDSARPEDPLYVVGYGFENHDCRELSTTQVNKAVAMRTAICNRCGIPIDKQFGRFMHPADIIRAHIENTVVPGDLK